MYLDEEAYNTANVHNKSDTQDFMESLFSFAYQYG
jgi:hypothetical protein